MLHFQDRNLVPLIEGCKSTTIRAGDRMGQYPVGKEVLCRSESWEAMCRVTSLTAVMTMGLTDEDARADGFQNRAELVRELVRLNFGKRDLEQAIAGCGLCLWTIIGLGVLWSRPRWVGMVPMDHLRQLQDLTIKTANSESCVWCIVDAELARRGATT